MKDLSNFLNEEDKKKDPKKPHATKEEELTDDKRYLVMMDEYKRLRRTDRDEANKLLDKAMKLGRTGNVSANAKLAAAYL